MGRTTLWSRVASSRLKGPDRARARADLAVAVKWLVAGEFDEAAAPLLAAHDAARSSVRLHTAAHVGRLARHLVARDFSAAATEMGPLLMAAPAAAVRRAAGVPSCQPPAGSLWRTWRSRMQ